MPDGRRTSNGTAAYPIRYELSHRESYCVTPSRGFNTPARSSCHRGQQVAHPGHRRNFASDCAAFVFNATRGARYHGRRLRDRAAGIDT
eukprot:6181418-Pleurochrysis_carterae.AAC.2